MSEWDRAAFLAINHGLKCAFLDWLMPHITDIGLGHVQAPAVVLLAVWLGIWRGEMQWREGLRGAWRAIYSRRAWVGPLLLCFALSGLLSTALKIIPRDRPWWYYEKEHRAGRHREVRVWTVEGVYPLKVRGFPSGHTATTVAMATVVTALFARKRGGLARILGAWAVAGLIALSRIYLASHWPLDVIGGATVGVVSGLLSVQLCRRWSQRKGTAPAANRRL